ncbi:kinase-like domain-containing protein [Zopfochytrium polystomum]|nr:kinase-like domain-containing protein [Zopfochytrium polystomum]
MSFVPTPPSLQPAPFTLPLARSTAAASPPASPPVVVLATAAAAAVAAPLRAPAPPVDTRTAAAAAAAAANVPFADAALRTEFGGEPRWGGGGFAASLPFLPDPAVFGSPPPQPDRTIPPRPAPPPLPDFPPNYAPPAAFTARYALRAFLGAGGFGHVCAAVEIATAPSSSSPDGSPPREGRGQLNHPNIIGYVDAFQDIFFVLLVTELHGGSWAAQIPFAGAPPSPPTTPVDATAATPPLAGLPRRASSDLFDCINLLHHLTECQARHVFRQLVAAVAHLDARGILHRDIKDENVLVDDGFGVRLADFGSASLAAQPGPALPAPLAAEDTLFLGTPPIRRARARRRLPPAEQQDRAAGVSDDCWDLLEWMFEKNPERRPSVAQVLAHPWIAARGA